MAPPGAKSAASDCILLDILVFFTFASIFLLNSEAMNGWSWSSSQKTMTKHHRCYLHDYHQSSVIQHKDGKWSNACIQIHRQIGHKTGDCVCLYYCVTLLARWLHISRPVHLSSSNSFFWTDILSFSNSCLFKALENHQIMSTLCVDFAAQYIKVAHLSFSSESINASTVCWSLFTNM